MCFVSPWVTLTAQEKCNRCCFYFSSSSFFSRLLVSPSSPNTPYPSFVQLTCNACVFQKSIVSVSLPAPDMTQSFFSSLCPQPSHLPSSSCVEPHGFLSHSAFSSRKASVDAVFFPPFALCGFFLFVSLSNSPFSYFVFCVCDACLCSAARISYSFVSLSAHFSSAASYPCRCLEFMTKEAKNDSSTRKRKKENTRGRKRGWKW